MSAYDFTVQLQFQHRIRFTKHCFALENPILQTVLEGNSRTKVVFFLERAVADLFPRLEHQIKTYIREKTNLQFTETHLLEGAEESKRSLTVLQSALDGIESAQVDRHSYVCVIGGGAFLDVIGFAAAMAHRGCRLVRFPTTTLAQDDSGVGVKNGINAYGKKNWLGAFAVPYAVINDFTFLYSQSKEMCRLGLIEAVKVALVRDVDFFIWLENHAVELRNLEPKALEEAVKRSAILHAQHIVEGGDPFEMGSSRPLDFGHWSAHKLEQISDFSLTHAEAVSVGLALDTLYSWKSGLLKKEQALRVIHLLKKLEMLLWSDCFNQYTSNDKRLVYQGIEEFREHLGGQLTVMMLQDLGLGLDVHHLDLDLLDECIAYLDEYRAFVFASEPQ